MTFLSLRASCFGLLPPGGAPARRATSRPSAGDLVLLPDPGFVLKPDLYRLAGSFTRCDLRHIRGEVLWDGPPPRIGLIT
jgi:hypothetical protein